MRSDRSLYCKEAQPTVRVHENEEKKVLFKFLCFVHLKPRTVSFSNVFVSSAVLFINKNQNN